MIKKHSIGYNTVSSVDGVISAKGVKSKPNNIRIFGYTHEIGEGEKSPDNPYQLVSLDSCNMSVNGVEYEHSITLTNNNTTIQVPIPVQLNSVNGTSDYILKDSDGIWKLMQNCQKYEFNGNEDCDAAGNDVFYIKDTVKGYQANNCVVCNSNFYTGTKNQINAYEMRLQINNSICFRIEPYDNTIYIKSTSFTTKNNFTSWLLKQYEVGTPLIMIYQLKIPIVHTLSNYAQELLNSFVVEDKNNIYVEGNPNIEISGYLKKGAT